jgi:imidazoleglycerol-phosphate dehydratase
MRTAPPPRNGSCRRNTREAIVEVDIALDGISESDIQTGIPMFDHLLAQFAFYAGCTARIKAQSLDAIRHHAVEDTAIALGTAIAQALAERVGIARFGEALLPMEDALVRVAIDLAARPYVRINLPLRSERIEELESSLIVHVLRTLAENARFTMHLDLLDGDDPHHCAEAAFKGVGRALRLAWKTLESDRPLSTKGRLV